MITLLVHAWLHAVVGRHAVRADAFAPLVVTVQQQAPYVKLHAAILEPTRAMRLHRQATGISSAVAFPRALTQPTLVAARHTGHNDVYSTLADPRGSSHRDRTISTRLGSATRATLI